MLKTNGTFIKHTSCPSCPSSDAFAVYRQEDGSMDGSCFSCGHYEVLSGSKERLSTVMQERNNVIEINRTKIEDIQKLPITEIPDRGITQKVAEKYGVRTSCSEKTGEIDTHYYPIHSKDGNLVGYKVRDVATKGFHSIGDAKNMCLFGSNIAGDSGKLLIITEGELDALAASQLFHQSGKNFRVVSLPAGANIRAIKDNLEWIDNFDNVVLAYDQDEPGRKCAKETAEILTPGKCKVMSFSEKDPCDMLLNKKGNEWYAAFKKASVHKPDGIVSIEDIYEEAIKQPERGLDWPWPKLSAVTYGRRRKELYGFGAGSGSGKTEAFKEIIQHTIKEDNLPVGLLFLEENPATTAKIIAGKMVGKRFHVPDGNYTKKDLRDGIESLKDKVFLYDHFGQKEWEAIKSKIRYMVISLGIKDIFLDHLTALVADEDDVNGALGKIMADMASMTQELDFTLYFISHLATPHGTPHEEGGRVTASQFRGSRTIMFWSHFLFGMERNQQADDINERNTVNFRCLKDRYTGLATGTTFKLEYDHETGRLLESDEVELEF